MVSKKSATTVGSVVIGNGDNIPMNLDHSDLVKFRTRDDPYYDVVRERISRLAKAAQQNATQRSVERRKLF